MRIVALAGGVGGAKLADGLAQVLNNDDLSIIVNTGDDFTHLGLQISPDLDTVCYTLAGLAHSETGWGRKNETWNVYDHLAGLGLPTWFKIGDADLATHLMRTCHLAEGWPLSKITEELCKIWHIGPHVNPMTDDIVRTRINTPEGELEFQDYFVRRKCEPIVSGFKFDGIEHARPAPGVLEAIQEADAIVICPSNPWVSIDPILSVPGVRTAMENHLIVAISPIIGNQTVKGPAAKMFSELSIQPSAYAVAEHYLGLVDILFIDHTDIQMAEKINSLGIRTQVTNILMPDFQERKRLAQEVIDAIQQEMQEEP